MDRRRRFRAAIARTGLAVLVAGGCATTTVRPSPVADPAASTRPGLNVDARAPTESVDERRVRESAAAAYLDAIEPTNEAYHALAERHAGATSLEANTAYCRELAEVDHELRTRIGGIAFPATMANETREFMAQLAVQEASERSCGRAASAAEWQRTWDADGIANERAHQLAYLIRSELGLLPDPG